MRHQFLSLMALVYATQASATDARTSDEMIAAFTSICLRGFGDLRQVETAARAAGFRPVPLDRRIPQSVISRRGRLFLAYRGAADHVGIPIPQCHVEMPALPDPAYDTMVAGVERALDLERGEPANSGESRHTHWLWHDGSHRTLRISLSAQSIAGEPTFLLAVEPLTP